MTEEKFATYAHWARSFSGDWGMLAPWNYGFRFEDFYKVFDADKRLVGSDPKEMKIKFLQMFNEYAEFLTLCVEEVLPEFEELLIQNTTNQKIVFEDFGYSYNRETQKYCLVNFNASIITRHYPEKVQKSSLYEQRKKIFEALAYNFPLKQYCIWTFTSNSFYNQGTDRFVKHEWCKAPFLRKRIDSDVIKECITGKYVKPWDVFFRSYRIFFNVCVPKWVILRGSECPHFIAGE